ncbi:interleukin 15, like isoform X2 [Morone saxatilis]|uniref:interleukin 15, like isoform X2 n=1 Tax=Morone saxatilis TaxID=34816 RepID=UPI0015E1D788|nr:interleukin 15, like isoform X2 [Morone saxatilis]
MPRGRLALVSVCLCLVCLIVLMPQAAARFCTRDSIQKIEHLIGKAPEMKGLNCRLYTPTIDHYKKCPSATMKCFAGEMNVLLDEWEITDVYLIKLKTSLKTLADRLNKTQSGCTIHCELFEMAEPEIFLNILRETLLLMNTLHCTQETR